MTSPAEVNRCFSFINIRRVFDGYPYGTRLLYKKNVSNLGGAKVKNKERV
jgi:hypothetical protein